MFGGARSARGRAARPAAQPRLTARRPASDSRLPEPVESAAGTAARQWWYSAC